MTVRFRFNIWPRVTLLSETIKRDTTSWIFPRNDSIMISDNCPFDYCNDDDFPSDNPNEQCNYETKRRSLR